MDRQMAPQGLPANLDRSADMAWQHLRAAHGLPEGGWSLRRIARRETEDTARIAFVASTPGGPRYVFRHQLRPWNPEGYAGHFRMQERAYDRFPHGEGLTMARPIRVEPDMQASLMVHLDGVPLSEAMREAAGDLPAQHALLERAGRWLGAYHGAAIEERRIFQPKYTIRYYEGLRAQVRDGKSHIEARELFLLGIDRLAGLGRRIEGRETVSAAQHGDLYMRNLILSDTQIAGIDVTRDEPAPVGHDIAKLLLDYVSILRDAEDVAPGEVVPEDALAAFFSGYRLVPADDPSVTLLLRARILATIADLSQPTTAPDHRERGLARLVPIAIRSFGGEVR